MKISIFIVVSLLSLLSWSVLTQTTILTYIIQHEIEQSDNYVELSLTVESEGKLMSKAISDAERVITKIQQISVQHCKSKAKTGVEQAACLDIVEASKYEVEPKYHLVRKVPTFTLFILNHKLTITIKHLEGLGKLVDRILNEGEGLVTINDFVWKADDELDPEKQTLKQGVVEGRQLCEELGKQLVEFISVQELQAPEEEADEDRDPDLAEEDVELTIFKFKVRCGDKKNKKSKK